MPYRSPCCLRTPIVAPVVLGILMAIIGAACSQPSLTSSETQTPSPSINPTPSPMPMSSPPRPLYPVPVSSTAVLFLVDESGGVSGKCKQEPTVDRENLRWEIVRFYITLWQAWYDSTLKWPYASGEKWPTFTVGVVGFAKGHAELLPFTDISELTQSEKWDNLRGLNDPISLEAQKGDWFCQTAYSSTLQEAASRLLAQDVSQRILILLTDGSFEGALPGDNRGVQRADVKRILEDLTRQRIAVRVLLLGEDKCRYGRSDDKEGCPLPAKVAEREDDLNTWWQWKIHVSGGDLFKALGETFQRFSLFPVQGGSWVRGPGEVQLPFMGRTEEVACIIVTSRAVEQGALHLRGEDGREINLFPQSSRPQWFRGELSLPSAGSECSPRQWSLEITENLTAYAWLVTAERQVSIASVEVDPDKIEIGQDKILTVTVNLTAPPVPTDCYRFSLTVISPNGGRKDCSPPSLSASSFFTQLCLVPSGIEWGLLEIQAQLVYVDNPDKSPAHEVRTVKAIVEPKVEVTSTRVDDSVIITITVSNRSDIPQLEMRPSLYPERFGEATPPPEPRPNCAATDPDIAEGLFECSWKENAFVCKVPWTQLLDCDYREMRIRWRGRDDNGKVDYEGVVWKTIP